MDRQGWARSAYRIETLRGVLEVLDCFAQQDAWALDALAETAGQPSPRVFQYLQLLEQRGYVAWDGPIGCYRPGPRLAALSEASALQSLAADRAGSPLQALADATGETAHIGILDGAAVVTVELAEGRHGVRAHVTVGTRRPAHISALGKALLAFASPVEIEGYLLEADRVGAAALSRDEAASLRMALQAIQSRGYALDREEAEPGLCCVAAPIWGAAGKVAASVSIAAPSQRLDRKGVDRPAQSVMECARALSRRIGGAAPLGYDG